VEQERSTWTWENLSREFPNDDDTKQLARLQRFAGQYCVRDMALSCAAFDILDFCFDKLLGSCV